MSNFLKSEAISLSSLSQVWLGDPVLSKLRPLFVQTKYLVPGHAARFCKSFVSNTLLLEDIFSQDYLVTVEDVRLCSNINGQA